MKKLVLILVCIGLLSLPLSAMAASEAEKRAAIDKGLAYLATVQQGDGRWIYDNSTGDAAATGSALLAFLEEKPNWGANAVAYQAIVDKGLTYLFSKAQTVAISNQPLGNPDGDGNGLGVKFILGGNNNRDTYVTGIVLPAIVASGTPNAVVANGLLTGWTYKQVVQNTIDYFAFGQSDPATGNARGGWRYYANQGSSDQSTAQWPVISALYAGAPGWGVTYPSFVKTELATWANYIQNTVAGNAGYESPSGPLGEMNETGALLIMQAYLGKGVADPKVALALNYINTHWKESANSTWDGNFNHPYAMWAIYKGLELLIGLDANTSIINNLRSDPGDVDNPNHGYNWWEDYCEFLVSSQNGNGSWNGYWYWTGPMATGWHINILAATKIPEPPNGIPEPATLILLGSGLVGLAVYARRRMKK